MTITKIKLIDYSFQKDFSPVIGVLLHKTVIDGIILRSLKLEKDLIQAFANLSQDSNVNPSTILIRKHCQLSFVLIKEAVHYKLRRKIWKTLFDYP